MSDEFNEEVPEDDDEQQNAEREVSLDDLNLDEGGDGGESDSEVLTPANVIRMMKECWQNEKFAPEVLPNNLDIVECLLGQIKYMDENLKRLQVPDLQRNLHQLEVDRLRFIVASYLRTRLEKIELYLFKVLEDEQKRADNQQDLYLTDSELTFAKQIRNATLQHLSNALKFIPGLPPDDWKSQFEKPNMHSYVFFKSNKRIDGVLVGNDDENVDVDLREGSQYIMPYNSVSTLLKNNDIHFL